MTAGRFAIILLATALALTGCGGQPAKQQTQTAPAQPAAPAPAPAPKDLGKVQIIIGINKTFEFLPAELGRELGVWKKRGLEVENVYVKGSGQVAQALAAGQGEIALSAGASGATPILKGLEAKAIAAIGHDFNMMVLVVPKSSKVSAAADLKGKAIGITSHGSLTDWLVDQLAASQKWSVGRDVRKAVVGGLTEQLAALKTGAIDAFVWSAEAGFELEEKGEGRVLMDFGQIVKNNVFEAIFATNKAVKERPEAVKAYLEGWYETIRYMKANKDATVKFMVKQFDMTENVARKTYELDINNLSTDGTIPEVNLQGLAESLVAMGIAKEKPPISQFFDGRFVPVKVGG